MTLAVADLRVRFGAVTVVDGVSLAVGAGELVALVGESGSGKTVTALSVLGLAGAGAAVSGSARLGDLELVGAPDGVLRTVRGARVAMVFQDPMTALNPVHRVGAQVAEQVRAHADVSRGAASERAVELLERVGVPDPAARARAWPHELSGGLRQRVMLAMALSCDPEVLIADEPTTALDVTVQAQILELLGALRDDGMAILLVTHDLGVVAQVADRVAVMYAGRIVETAPALELFAAPRHPYTQALLEAVPRLDRPRRARLGAIAGAPPAPGRVPAGCAFRGRCPFELERCAQPVELLPRASTDHLDRCVLERRT